MLSKETKPVIVIGAGIAGLTTARLLVQNGFPVIVFEQSSPDRSQGYGITVREWAFQPMLSSLDEVPVDEFISGVAVDRRIGGRGAIDLALYDNRTGEQLMAPEASPDSDTAGPALFRANRCALRDWLSVGVDVRYEHRLISVDGAPGALTARFTNGVEVEGSMVVAADGLHSTLRQTMFPRLKPAVLPVVVFHGDLHVDRAEFDANLAPHRLGSSNVVGGVGDNFNTPITIADAGPDGVFLDWTYSRAVRTGDGGDTLWQPERDPKSPVPEELIVELKERELAPPFSTIVDPERISKSEVHNWLSRTVFMPRFSLDKAAEKGIVFIGDAAHAMPIFGGEGGNHAMLDGVELATLIGTESSSRALEGKAVGDIIEKFYQGAYQRGQEAVKRCRQRFALLHRPIAQWHDLADMARSRAAAAAAKSQE